MLAKTLMFIGLLSGTSMLLAQASSTASRKGDLQIGGGYASADSDYLPVRYTGETAYVDFNFRQRLGVEGEFNFVKDSVSGSYEKTYEIGPRYSRTYNRFTPYAKILVGRGVYNYMQPIQLTPSSATTYFLAANLAYNMLSGGLGADYRVTGRINARVGWEYQRWLNFQDSSLSPSILMIGAAYHFQ